MAGKMLKIVAGGGYSIGDRAGNCKKKAPAAYRKADTLRRLLCRGRTCAARGVMGDMRLREGRRAGHARPLRTSVPGQSFHPAERGTINRTPKRPKNRLVRHCGQNAHNNSENMCNFLNKTPLRKGGFFGTIKLCKSVCLELCPEQDWGMCQMTQDLCGPDNRTAL